MGFGGSVAAMLQSIRTNKALLRQRGDWVGERALSKPLLSYKERARRRRNQPKASAAYMEGIRTSAEIDRRRKRVLAWLFTFAGLILTWVIVNGLILHLDHPILWRWEPELTEQEKMEINRYRIEEVRAMMQRDIPRADAFMAEGDYFQAMGLYKQLWSFRKPDESLARKYVLATVYFSMGQEGDHHLVAKAWSEYIEEFSRSPHREELENVVYPFIMNENQ